MEYLSSCLTSSVAANALDMEAIWNKVWLVTGLFHCVSVTPYPLANNRCPSLTTLTVKPGFWGWHFSAYKIIVITCRYLKLHSNSLLIIIKSIKSSIHEIKYTCIVHFRKSFSGTFLEIICMSKETSERTDIEYDGVLHSRF